MNTVHINSLDLNLLAVFAAVYRRRNLTLAGEELGLSQSAVSHALSRLRARFDDALFLRRGNAMEPTELAENLAAGILPALEMVEGTLRHGSGFSPATARRTFRLGMNDYGGAILLPALVRHLQDEAPGVTLHVINSTHEERQRMLEEGALDAAVGCYPMEGRHILQAGLLRDREACVMRREHPLAGGILTPERFRDVPFIALSLSSSGTNVLDRVLEKHGCRLHPVVTVEQELTVPELVQATGLAGTMAQRLAALTVRNEELVVRPLPFAEAEFSLSLYWHASRDSEPGQRWLRERLVEAAASLPPLGTP